jgi:molybdenum-dependent DNA-binding transcriptional regulator ModE
MLAQIRSFLTLVEEGSLHRAAARLRISQSALSRQMQALEHELGGRLLERMTTGVSPTAGGQALAKKMGAVLAAYDLAMSDTRRALRGDRSGANWLPPIGRPSVPERTVEGSTAKSSENGFEARGLISGRANNRSSRRRDRYRHHETTAASC